MFQDRIKLHPHNVWRANISDDHRRSLFSERGTTVSCIWYDNLSGALQFFLKMQKGAFNRSVTVSLLTPVSFLECKGKLSLNFVKKSFVEVHPRNPCLRLRCGKTLINLQNSVQLYRSVPCRKLRIFTISIFNSREEV